MRWSSVFGVFCAWMAASSAASAHQPPRGDVLLVENDVLIVPTPREQTHLTLAATFGVLDQGTTGTLAAYGYDRGNALSLGLDARLVLPLPGCRCMTHGVDLAFLYANGTALGASGESAWRRGIVDLGYAFRIELPCLRRGTRRWWVAGTVGFSGQLADAGLGDVATGDPVGLNERVTASQRYDQAALGWHLGASMEVVFDKTLVGFGLDVRDLYGFDTDQVRTFLMGANLRVGVDLGL